MGAKRAIQRLFVEHEIAREVSAKYIRARIEINKMLPAKVTSEKEFYQLITRIVQFYEKETGGIPSGDSFAFQKAEQILSQYAIAGILSAFDASTKHVEGGVLGIASAICTAMKTQSEEHRLDTILRQEIGDEFNSLERLKFTEEYKAIKGRGLPETMQNANPGELIGKIKEVIKRDLQIADTFQKTLGI